MTEGEPRFRINAKQTAKGLWQFDGTVEHHDDKWTTQNIKDTADPKIATLGLKLLSMIQEAEEVFKADGRKLVSDIKEQV